MSNKAPNKKDTETVGAGVGFVNTKYGIEALVSKKEVVEKKKVLLGVNLDRELADKVKSFAFTNNHTVTEVLEIAVKNMFDHIVVNKDSLEEYNEKYRKGEDKRKNKGKGRGKNK